MPSDRTVQSQSSPEPTQPLSSKSTPMIHLDQLNRLNRLHAYPHSLRPPLQSGGLLHEAWYKLRRKLAALLLPELERYTASEAEFQANLVQYLNELARTVDAWNKEATEKRFETLESVVFGLESIVARLSRTRSFAVEAEIRSLNASQSVSRAAPDYSYLMLENRFRGTEEVVSRRLADYPSLFAKVQGPVLEIGSGRGELQQLFRQAGIPSYGVELAPAMYEHCIDKKLDVRLEDGLTHLSSLSDHSLGGIIAIQVIEHLPVSALKELMQLCCAKTVTGGRVVFETVNTSSVTALCQNYYRDPTHVQPLHPDTICYLMELAGLRVLDLKELSPFPQEAILQPLPKQVLPSAKWAGLADLLNHNFTQLNRLLYGFQDYCVIAEVRAG